MQKGKNIIFLDIDGVLNCQLFYETREKYKPQQEQEYEKAQICPVRLKWLSELIKEVDAEIVISSSWRQGRSVQELNEIFKYCGYELPIIDKTPYTGYERGTEISKWLHDNINEEKYGCLYFDFYRYVIIDDDSDMLLNQKEHFFQTDNYSGLTPSTCYRIKRFFTKRTF